MGETADQHSRTYSDPEAWRVLLFSGGWGRAAHRGSPRGRHVLGIASTACGLFALVGAALVSWFLTSGLGWYGPRAMDEVGRWALVQSGALVAAWVCTGAAIAGLACGAASLIARWSLGLTVIGLTLSAAAGATVVQAWGLFFWNHL